MKFEYKNSPAVIEGNIESANYGAKEQNIPFLMSMLQTTLYSDKPLAVCREYITNAWDAHVDADKPELPIHISMPTTFNPVLKIRDFGKGLSKDDVLHHFTSYGESGKRHTDKMVGGFGLGSKSAFCYVPSFTVISYHDGVKMTFNAMIEETNTTMNHLRDLDVPTDETGIEIQVAIQSYDIYSFRSTLVHLLRFHKPFPVITNDTYILQEINQPLEVLLEGDNWQIISDDSNIGNTVVLGNVPYNFNTSKYDYEFRDRISQFGNLRFVLFMEPNELNVSLNRESLEYSPKTLKNLRETLTNAMDEFEKQFLAKFDEFDSVWKAKNFMLSFENHRTRIKPVVDGHRIDTTTISLSGLRFNEKRRLLEAGRWSKTETFSINCSPNAYIFIARPDIAKSSIRVRIQMFMDNHGLSASYGIAERFYFFLFDTHDDADDFVNSTHLRGANIIELNTIVLPKVTKANVRTAMIHSEGYIFRRDSEFYPAKVELNHGEGVYVPIAYNHCSTRMPVWWQENTNLSYLVRSVENYDSNLVLHGIKNQEVSRLGKGWIRFDQYIQDLLDNLPGHEVEKFTKLILMDKYKNDLFSIRDYMSIDHPFYNVANRFHDYSYADISHFRYIYNHLNDAGLKIPTWQANIAINEMEEFIQQYPILNLLVRGSISLETDGEIVKHYLAKDQ